MRSLHLFPQKHKVENGKVTRSCMLKWLDADDLVREECLWYEIDQVDKIPDDSDCESYVVAMLMDAMLEDRALILHGKACRELLGNLLEFQGAWSSWVPELSAIEIQVDEIDTSTQPSASGAICAFSGGVDATFSVWRNSQGLNGYRSQPVSLCSVVQGFDIPLRDTTAFNNVIRNSSKTLASIGVKLRPVRTNYRKISNVKWIHAHAAALVAALSNYKGISGSCIVGSSEPYSDLVIPWGSCPITDHLLGSSEFKVIHDGATHTRSEKVLEISNWKEGCDNLRVCWEGALKDRNCGKCEKCLRTKLCFAVNNLEIPSCFENKELKKSDIRKVKHANYGIRNEWRLLHKAGMSNKIKAGWFAELSKQVRIGQLIDTIFPEGSIRKQLAKKIFALRSKTRKEEVELQNQQSNSPTANN